MEVSLALGGGGIKGVAHIGVIQCLEDAGIKIRAIAGTSAGGLVGALYAAGANPRYMASLLENIPHGRLFSRSHTDGPSLLGMGGISHILSEELGEITFDSLKIPFACTAVDIRTSSEIIMMDGQVSEAVLASAAMPGIFPARTRGEALLVDGGVLDPVPVSLARWLAPAHPVVAVVLSPVPESWAGQPPIQIPHSSNLQGKVIEQMSRLRFGQALNIFIQSMDITARMLTELRLEIDQPEVIIRPDVNRFGWLQEVDPGELIEIGEKTASEMLPELYASFSWRGQLSRRMRRVDPPKGLMDALK